MSRKGSERIQSLKMQYIPLSTKNTFAFIKKLLITVKDGGF